MQRLAWTKPKAEEPFSAPMLDPPFRNLLVKTKPHMLFIMPWLAVGGADLYNAFLTRALVERGWDVTVVTTVCGDHSQYPRFASHTPDVFVMPRFLKLDTRPAFLSYLIESRQPDVVALTNSELAYEMLPYVVQRHPEPLYIDIGHMEEEYWRSGGYPRYSVGVNSILDHSIVISHHLKDWMVKQGADPEKITAVHIGVDTQKWKRSEEARAHVRGMYNISRDTTVLLFVGRLSYVARSPFPWNQYLIIGLQVAEESERAPHYSQTSEGIRAIVLRLHHWRRRAAHLAREAAASFEPDAGSSRDRHGGGGCLRLYVGI